MTYSGAMPPRWLRWRLGTARSPPAPTPPILQHRVRRQCPAQQALHAYEPPPHGLPCAPLRHALPAPSTGRRSHRAAWHAGAPPPCSAAHACSPLTAHARAAARLDSSWCMNQRAGGNREKIADCPWITPPSEAPHWAAGPQVGPRPRQLHAPAGAAPHPWYNGTPQRSHALPLSNHQPRARRRSAGGM